MKNYYTILQVRDDADATEIRQAFRRLSKQYHPDRNGGGKYYEEKFKEINEAYQTLKDPIRRWQYKQDRQRPAPGASRPGRNWDTPDFAGQQAKERKRRHHYGRPAADASGGASTWSDFRAAAWSVVLVLVFLLPFRLAKQPVASQAGEKPSETEKREWVKLEQPETATFQFAGLSGKRLDRDVQLLKEIRRIDPNLQGLDLETGYYMLRGKPVRLSWQILQLIRERSWKNN